MRRLACFLLGHDARIVGLLKTGAAWRQCRRCRSVLGDGR